MSSSKQTPVSEWFRRCGLWIKKGRQHVLGYCEIKRLFDQLDRIEALSTANQTKLLEIEGILNTMSAEFDDLKTIVDKLVVDINQTLTDGGAASTALHAQIDALTASVADLKAGDVIKDSTITDLQAQLDAAKASATALTASLKAADDAVVAADAGLQPPTPPQA